METKLLEIYTDPKNTGSFGGVAKLYRAAIDANVGATRDDVRQFLSSVKAYSLTKPKLYNFKRSRVKSSGINDVHMADLADWQHLSEFNDGYKYWLVVVDFFRKHLWVVPMKNKTSTTTKNAFSKIYSNEQNRPRYLGTDYGGEFYGKPIEEYFKDLGIAHYSVPNRETKASAAERAIRTIKTLCSRWMLHNLSQRYIDILPTLVNNYNHTKSRTTGFAPAEIDTTNSDQVLKKLYPELWSANPQPRKKQAFDIGDSVRLATERTLFQKGYHITWTPEIFKIHEIVSRDPYVYRVADSKSEVIKGTFYKYELAKVKNSDNVYLIEKVVSSRKVAGGKRQFLVKWLGFPNSENTYISEDDLIRTQQQQRQEGTLEGNDNDDQSEKSLEYS